MLDLNLPGTDGREVLRTVKSDANLKAIPIIVLSSMLSKNDEKKARVAGCDAYIAKPFRQQELHATIEELLKASIDALLLKSGSPLPGVLELNIGRMTALG